MNDPPMTVMLNSGATQAQETAQCDHNSRLTHVGAAGPNRGAITTTLNGAYDFAYNAATWTIAYTTTINSGVTATQLGHESAGRLTPADGAATRLRVLAVRRRGQRGGSLRVRPMRRIGPLI